MSGQLQGKRALVTGASRGIGRAMALAFAAEGAQVVALARNDQLLAELVAQVVADGGQAEAAVCDVSDHEAVMSVVGQIVADGPLDIVVNNAGGNSFSAPLVAMRPSGWDKTMTLNLNSTFWVLQAVLPGMMAAGRGSIINVASVAGLRGAPFMAHYAAAKSAVVSLTESAALETAAAGVRVNALLPGWIATDLTDFLRTTKESEAGLLSRVPMGRWGEPAEIAAAAVFLASDASSFMTGQSLIIDGGLAVMP